jgi:A/G-specific adenine glycosylase
LTVSTSGRSFVPGQRVALRLSLLGWYGEHKRDLPWRRTSDPYAIWVSEIMLQQTRVAAVLGRYQDFLKSFPTVAALAAAAEDDLLALWSGLGYYRRARMMHKAAKEIAGSVSRAFPATAAGLRGLPGIGAYTSAAIASIAFGEPVAVVDGNVERVVQRLAGLGSDSRDGQAELGRRTFGLAAELLDRERPGDFNQAMMELGATVCLPRNPQCLFCPVRPFCATQGEHLTVRRTPMRVQHAAYALVTRRGVESEPGEVLLERRSDEQTVMPGMWELPPLLDAEVTAADTILGLRHAIMQVNYRVAVRPVSEQELAVLAGPSSFRRWVSVAEISNLPLTGLARKTLLRLKLSLPPARAVQ